MQGLQPIGMAVVILLLATPVAAAEDGPEPPAVLDDVPNLGRPLSHEELLAFRGEMADPDQFVTVVADARIERRAARDSEWGPILGVLPRDDQPGHPAVEGSRRVRALYREDESVDGLAAFFITQDILVRGSVATPAGTYLTPIEPASMVAADTLAAGALIVVRGWLSRSHRGTPCPEAPKPLQVQRLGGGSPFLDCPAGWLTADEVTAAQSDDAARPGQPAIRVQYGAADHFDQRDHAETYLLRRIPNPTAGPGPELGWEVLARLDAIDLPRAVTGTPATIGPSGHAWAPGLERLPPADMHSPQLEDDSFMTTWAGGFASVHQGRDRVASSWVSTDGLTWEPAELPRRIGRVDALLRLGDGLVIIADSQLGSALDPDWRFDVWRSGDGLHWRRVARQEFPAWEPYTPANGYQRIIEGYWSVGDTIVAHETFDQGGGAGGRVAGWDVVRATTDRPPTFAWFSGNGKEWEKRYVRGLDRGLGRHAQIRESNGELWSISSAPDTRIHHSTNGVNWERVGRGPQDLAQHRAWARLLSPTDQGYVLTGISAREQAPDETWRGDDIVWFSEDLREWAAVASPPRGAPLAIATAGQTVVIVGGDALAGYDQDVDPAWWLIGSDDGGRTWDGSEGWASAQAWCPRSLASAGEVILLEFACAPPDAATWYAVEVNP